MTPEEVGRLRRMRVNGVKPAVLAAQFGITRGQVQAYTSGKVQPGAPGPILPVKPRLKAAQVLEIRRRVAEGESQTHLAAEFHCGPNNISMIISRKSWKHI